VFKEAEVLGFLEDRGFVSVKAGVPECHPNRRFSLILQGGRRSARYRRCQFGLPPLDRPGFVEAEFSPSAGFQMGLLCEVVGFSLGRGMLSMAEKSRRLLYQSTHSKVAISTASRPRHGP